MRRRLGRDVLEDERLLVLVDDLGGYLASDDAAEQALLQRNDYSLLGPPPARVLGSPVGLGPMAARE